MYALITDKNVYPNFQVQELNSQASIYNTTFLQEFPFLVLPSGGIYRFQFENNTLVKLSLERFEIQQTSIDLLQLTQNTFAQQSYDTTQPLPNNVSPMGYYAQRPRPAPEYLYIEGDSFTVNTTTLSQEEVIVVSLPTYVEFQMGLETYNSYYNADSVMVYPTNSFFTNTNVINPSGWYITTPYGIQYSVSVVPIPGTLYTVAFDLNDINNNEFAFTINDTNLPNSAFNSTPTIDMDFVPQFPLSWFNTLNPQSVIIDGQYDYGNFNSLGISDGIMAGDYPVFFKEQFTYVANFNSNDNMFYYNTLGLISLRGTKKGIKLYGLFLGASEIVEVNDQVIMESPLIIPANYTGQLLQTLYSSGGILPTLISSNTSSITMSTTPTSSSSSSQNASQITSNQTTTNQNNNKSLSLADLLSTPIIVLLLALTIFDTIMLIAIASGR